MATRIRREDRSTAKAPGSEECDSAPLCRMAAVVACAGDGASTQPALRLPSSRGDRSSTQP